MAMVDWTEGPDLVPVIRCRDCASWGKEPAMPYAQEFHYCECWQICTTESDFCARAERKEE